MIQDDFTASVGRFVAQAKERARVAFVATAFECHARVRELTPIRTGWLRANWQIQRDGEEKPAFREGLPGDAGAAMEMLDRLKREQQETGTPDANQKAEQVMDAQLGEVIRIVNPVVYARAVEYGREIERADGSTTTTQGRGMAAQTIAEAPAIAQAVVQAIRGR